jgi:hypothetical protein
VKVRKKLFEEAHKLEYEYVPAVTVHAPEVNHCYWNYVKGFNGYATFEERFWGVWLDK